MASNKEVKNSETINIALDETKSTVKKTTDEAIKEIPRFTKAVNEYQQETIQASKDIADSFLDSQKEVIHSMQSLWVPYIENCTKFIFVILGFSKKIHRKLCKSSKQYYRQYNSRNQISKQ